MQDRQSLNDLNILKKNMKDVINKSFQEDNQTKRLLNELFQNLTEYTNKKFDTFQKQREDEIRNYEFPFRKLWNVYTVLIDKSNSNNFGEFKPILPKLEKLISSSDNGDFYSNNFIGVFFRCSYDEFIKITDYSNPKKYKIEINNGKQTKTIFFHFKRSDIFVREENILYEIAAQYGYNFPVIYSPYSRRFAHIIFSDPEIHIENITKALFKDSELYNAIEATTCEKILAWNIWTGGPDSLQEEKTIVSDSTNLKYATIKSTFQCNEDQYINFHSFSQNRLEIQRKFEDKYNTNFSRKVITSVMHNSEVNLSYSIITIKEPSELNTENIQLFHNYYMPNLLIKHRLNSYADIRYTISGFQNNPYGIQIDDKIEICNLNNKNSPEFEDNKQSNIITDYNSSDCYYKYAIPETEPWRTIKTGQKAACLLTFHKTSSFKGNINFIEDYARYVLSYLNETYPEFNWKGKKGCLK